MTRRSVARRSLPVALASLLAIALAGPGLAAKPTREVLEPAEPFVVSGVCDFDVLFEDVKVGYAIMTWDRPDGSTAIIAAGQWQIRLTNLDSGATMDVVISGPEFVNFDEESFSDVGTGRWLLFDEGAGMWLASGRFDLTAGDITDIRGTIKGHSIDICAALAA